MKEVKIKIQNPTLRQKIIVVSANFLLKLIIILFRNNQSKRDTELKEVLTAAIKSL